jgi:GNAT superfamily N-acetyltransferase
MTDSPLAQLVGELTDGRSLYVRELRADDMMAARHVNLGLSPRSSYLRYFGTFACAGDGEIRRILQISADRISLVGEVAGEPVALAEADGVGASDGCELALSVIDSYQGRGIGTLLMAELVRRVRGRGVMRMRADVLHDNRVMLELLRRSGLPVTLTLARDVDRAMVSLPSDDLRGGAIALGGDVRS